MNPRIITYILIFSNFIAFSQTRYVDTVFDSTTVKTYNYSVRNKDTLKLDIYEPVNDSINKRPLMVLVHAGGFTSGERNTNSLVYIAENIAKKGYVVASIDYRLYKARAWNCSLPAKNKIKVYSNAAEDLLNALSYLVNYKESFNIDDTKIILFGASAGAQTALNIVYNRDFLIKSSDAYKSIKPAAIISISGAILEANLITKENAIPTVLYHGVNDKVVPYNTSAHQSCLPTTRGFLLISGSKTIAEKLENNNTSYLLYSYQNKGHNIFNLPNDDLYQAFVFLNKTVFDKKFYQARINQ